jgi:hypothetical protein
MKSTGLRVGAIIVGIRRLGDGFGATLRVLGLCDGAGVLPAEVLCALGAGAVAIAQSNAKASCFTPI